MSPKDHSVSDPARIGRPVFALAMVWTVLIAVLMACVVRREHEEMREVALLQARANADKDQALRLWASRHGGVYVPVDARTPPNPHLSHVPERDLVTPSGRRLTLMNSGYMLRQIMEEYGHHYGVKGRITSLKPVRQQNAPDAWERRALEAFEQGAPEFYQFTTIGKQPYLRLMRPMVTERACLKCHAVQGYAVGDVRGGAAIGLPLAPLLAQKRLSILTASGGLGVVWLLGCFTIFFTSRDLRRRTAEREHLLHAVTQAKEEWERTFETVPDLIAIIDCEHKIVRANRALGECFGKKPGDIVGRPCTQVFHGTDTPPPECPHARLLLDGQEHAAEIFEPSVNRWFLVTASPLRTAAGALTGSVHAARDITDRKRAEEELRRQNEVLDTILGSIPIMVALHDPDGKPRWVNRCWTETTGWSAEEALSRDLSAEFYPDPAEQRRIVEWREKSNGEWSDFPTRVRDGRTLGLSWVAVRLSDGSRIAIGLDLTERLRQEEERRQFDARVQNAQRLESLGVLAGGVAHDFNNLLTAVLGNTGLALMHLAPGAPARRFVQEAEAATLRAAELSSQMLAYSGKGRFVITRVDLSRVVEEMQRLLAAAVPRRCGFYLDLARDLPATDADAAQIRQVIMNLITNAAEAIGENDGIITIRTRVLELDGGTAGGAHLDEPLPAGRYVELQVSDTGCGMDAQTQARVFEPFFTTKFAGRGLGMAAVLGIVRGHHGAIWVESAPGQGSTFRVLFPAAD